MAEPIGKEVLRFALGIGCRLSDFAAFSPYHIIAMCSVLVSGVSLERRNWFIKTRQRDYPKNQFLRKIGPSAGFRPRPLASVGFRRIPVSSVHLGGRRAEGGPQLAVAIGEKRFGFPLGSVVDFPLFRRPFWLIVSSLCDRCWFRRGRSGEWGGGGFIEAAVDITEKSQLLWPIGPFQLP